MIIPAFAGIVLVSFSKGEIITDRVDAVPVPTSNLGIAFKHRPHERSFP
jgi:hypothetical protein